MIYILVPMFIVFAMCARTRDMMAFIETLFNNALVAGCTSAVLYFAARDGSDYCG